METERSPRKRSTCGDVEQQSLLRTPSKAQESFPSAASVVGFNETPPSSPPGSWRLLIASILFFLLGLAMFLQWINLSKFDAVSLPCVESSGNRHHHGASEPSASIKHTYEYPNVIYGHAHIAKTAGTTLNGNLSMHYERICGHKGYSFDAIETNERFKKSGHSLLSYKGDSYSKLRTNFNRAKVPHSLMKEIGFQDCDWISHETTWEWWLDFANSTIPLELHVPCRSPVDHLMSQCNFRLREFDCNKTGNALILEIKQCILFIDYRYNKILNETFDTKCFDFAKTNDYMEWMGQRLQRRRIEDDFFFRRSNLNRRKDQECVWNRPDVQKVIETHLLETYDYYKFCDKCLGSEQDLFAT